MILTSDFHRERGGHEVMDVRGIEMEVGWEKERLLGVSHGKCGTSETLDT